MESATGQIDRDVESRLSDRGRVRSGVAGARRAGWERRREKRISDATHFELDQTGAGNDCEPGDRRVRSGPRYLRPVVLRWRSLALRGPGQTGEERHARLDRFGAVRGCPLAGRIRHGVED